LRPLIHRSMPLGKPSYVRALEWRVLQFLWTRQRSSQ
jgi:hypothetical protein